MYENAIIITASKENVENILDRIVKDEKIDFSSILPETWKFDNETTEDFQYRIDSLKRIISYSPTNKHDEAYITDVKVIEPEDCGKTLTRILKFSTDYPVGDFVSLLSIRYPESRLEYKYVNAEKHCCATETYLNGKWEADDIVLNEDKLDDDKRKTLILQYAQLHYDKFALGNSDDIDNDMMASILTELSLR